MRFLRPARLLLLAGLMISTAAGGCARPSDTADRLRRQVLELEGRVQDLERRNLELQSRLDYLTDGDPAIDPEVEANLPQVVQIAIDRRSFARDLTGDGRADAVRLYVSTLDGRGRFVQVAGRIHTHAAALPSDADAVTIGRLTLGPAALRDAYRSGVMGTRYVIDLPIEPGSVEQATVRIELEDGLTGRVLTAERSVDLTVR